MNVPILDSPSKGNYMVLVLLCLASFTQHSVFKAAEAFLAWAVALKCQVQQITEDVLRIPPFRPSVR